MRPLLVLLERLWGPPESTRVLFWSSWSVFGGSWMALGDSIGASWGAIGRVLGALGELLGTSSAQENLYFLKTSISHRWEHDFGNLSEQGTGSACKWKPRGHETTKL